jgi:hypothetical protein
MVCDKVAPEGSNVRFATDIVRFLLIDHNARCMFITGSKFDTLSWSRYGLTPTTQSNTNVQGMAFQIIAGFA